MGKGATDAQAGWTEARREEKKHTTLLRLTPVARPPSARVGWRRSGAVKALQQLQHKTTATARRQMRKRAAAIVC